MENKEDKMEMLKKLENQKGDKYFDLKLKLHGIVNNVTEFVIAQDKENRILRELLEEENKTYDNLVKENDCLKAIIRNLCEKFQVGDEELSDICKCSVQEKIVKKY